jgi:hypothetical protein
MRLYLLVSLNPSPSRAVEVNGRLWSLQPFDLDDSSDEIDLAYSCISYTWGSGRRHSPFDPSLLVSDRTVPALQTFTRHRPSCSRIWIDAFCVPSLEPERTQTLQSMGYIYARADEVLVVLSSAALPALTRMLDSSHLEVNDLAVLEREGWVERAWTYQEAVNSKALSLSCEGEASALVPANRFFDCLGYALAHCTSSILDKLRTFPRLNAFEDIMADFYTASYQDRAALNVMSNMDRRVQERAEDHFYAMIGAISAEQSSAVGKLLPCEAFMSVCEMKGDFSFIFSASKRAEMPLKGWRPIHGDLPSILPWHASGSRQSGQLCHDVLWLDDMLVVHPAQPQEEARVFVQRWLTAFWGDQRNAQENLEDAAYSTLRVMGFTGSARCVTTTGGFFYSFEPVASERVIKILVSTALRWRMGAPGLVLYQERDKQRISYSPGVYVGAVEEKYATSVRVG